MPTEGYTTVIAGSRGIEEEFGEEHARELVWSVIDATPFEIAEIVSGGADGVDALAEEYAEVNDFPLTVMEVTDEEWEKFGDYAGPRRNARMAGYADAAIVFRIDESPGSTNMIREAENQIGEEQTFIVDIDTPGV